MKWGHIRNDTRQYVVTFSFHEFAFAFAFVSFLNEGVELGFKGWSSRWAEAAADPGL